MAIDQEKVHTESTTDNTATQPRDVQSILNSLPVQTKTLNRLSMESILDSIVKETEETSPAEEGPFIRAFLTGLNWTTSILAIGVVLFLTWAAGVSIMKYLAHQ